MSSRHYRFSGNYNVLSGVNEFLSVLPMFLVTFEYNSVWNIAT